MRFTRPFLAFNLFGWGALALPVNESGSSQPVGINPPSHDTEFDKRDNGAFGDILKQSLGSVAQEKSDQKYKDICHATHMNKAAWQRLGMDTRIKQLTQEYPKNPMPNDIKITEGSSFPEYLAQITGTVGNIECGPLTKCELGVDDIPNCEKHPIIYFAMYAMSNFQSWQKTILETMKDQHDSIQDKQGDMVQKFTSHAMSSDLNNSGFIIAAGVLGILGSFFGPVAAGGVAITSGFLAGAAVTAAGTFGFAKGNGLAVIQKEIENNAAVGKVLGIIHDGVVGGVNATSRQVLGSKPIAGRIVDVLSGGNFAEPPNEVDVDGFSEKFSGLFAATIVESAWFLEQVFIVKASESISGDDPCDCELDGSAVAWGDARVCIDGTAYIFVKTGDISCLSASDCEYENPKGLDDLEEYGLNLEKLARAAVWFQDKFGGYGKSLSNNELMEYTGTEDGPPGNLWVNLPIIDYADTPSISYNSFHYFGSWNHHFHRLINNCRLWIQDEDEWPYKGLGPY